jgi:hypothetical protein
MRTPAQLVRRWKRRKPGVYLYRTWRHLQPTRSEWGYGGKARDLDVRKKCHLGTCHHKGCTEKGWADLIIRRYTLQLPWWLGFDWITLSLETLLISVFRPRYNWQKNPRRSKVGPREQLVQRREREMRPASYTTKVRVARIGYIFTRVLGLALVLTGAIGWWVTR